MSAPTKSPSVMSVLTYLASHDWDGDAGPGNALVDAVVEEVGRMVDFQRRTDEIAHRIIKARTRDEEIAACRDMAEAFNADLDACLARDPSPLT